MSPCELCGRLQPVNSMQRRSHRILQAAIEERDQEWRKACIHMSRYDNLNPEMDPLETVGAVRGDTWREAVETCAKVAENLYQKGQIGPDIAAAIRKLVEDL